MHSPTLKWALSYSLSSLGVSEIYLFMHFKFYHSFYHFNAN